MRCGIKLLIAAANGYNAGTGTAKYTADFRKHYFAAQNVSNNHSKNEI
jgi:hypothetical protein